MFKLLIALAALAVVAVITANPILMGGALVGTIVWSYKRIKGA